MKIARQQLRGHVPDVVSKLKPVGPLAESTPIDVVIALPTRNAELRTALLRDIYDPASPRFHQYLSHPSPSSPRSRSGYFTHFSL